MKLCDVQQAALFAEMRSPSKAGEIEFSKTKVRIHNCWNDHTLQRSVWGEIAIKYADAYLEELSFNISDFLGSAIAKAVKNRIAGAVKANDEYKKVGPYYYRSRKLNTNIGHSPKQGMEKASNEAAKAAWERVVVPWLNAKLIKLGVTDIS